MSRPWNLFALVALVAVALTAVPGVGGHGLAMPPGGYVLTSGDYLVLALDEHEASAYMIGVNSTVPIDVVILLSTTPEQYFAGSPALAELLDVTAGNLTLQVASEGPYSLLIDNTAQPAQGANGTLNATVRVDLVTTVRPHDDSPGGALWPTLMFRSPYWDAGGLGLGGVTLWMFAIGCAALAWLQPPRVKAAMLAVATMVAALLWGLLPHPGALTLVGLPMLIGASVAWYASRKEDSALEALKLAVAAAALGFIAGAVMAHFLLGLASHQGAPILGADRFADAIFVGPLAAALGIVLFRGMAALVEVLEPQEETTTPVATTGLGDTFRVNCIRCKTPITVDRSMKRYRVATDRFEFSCPNCQAWMEWADPTARPSA